MCKTLNTVSLKLIGFRQYNFSIKYIFCLHGFLFFYLFFPSDIMAARVVFLLLLLHNGWARDVCPDAPRCSCRPNLVICRRSTRLPGVISRGSWPLSEAPPIYADLQESALTATRLFEFVTMFPTLQKLDISNPKTDIPCPFIKVLQETLEGLEIVSDCIQISHSDLTSTASSPEGQPMDSSTTSGKILFQHFIYDFLNVTCILALGNHTWHVHFSLCICLINAVMIP